MFLKIVTLAEGVSAGLFLAVNNTLKMNGTLMCLSIGTPKIINFPFVPNGKFIIFRCPEI